MYFYVWPFSASKRFYVLFRVACSTDGRNDQWWRTEYKCITDLHLCNWKMKIHRNQASWIKLCARSALDFILGSGYDIIFVVCELCFWIAGVNTGTWSLTEMKNKKTMTENQFFARNRICFAVSRNKGAICACCWATNEIHAPIFRLEWVEKISENLDTF